MAISEKMRTRVESKIICRRKKPSLNTAQHSPVEAVTVCDSGQTAVFLFHERGDNDVAVPRRILPPERNLSLKRKRLSPLVQQSLKPMLLVQTLPPLPPPFAENLPTAGQERVCTILLSIYIYIYISIR